MEKNTKLRPSPSKSATLYKNGTVKTGNDGNKWIIVENKNGVKRWNLFKNFFDIKKIITENELEKITLQNENSKKIYKIIKIQIIPEINKLGIKTFIIPLPLSKKNMYWNDYSISFLEEVLNIDIDNYLDNKFMNFIFYLNYDGDKIVFERPITIEYSEFNKNEKIKITDIFEKHLLGYYEWNDSNNNTMIIHYEKKNIKQIPKSKLKDNDTYPYLNIYIYTQKDLFKETDLRNLLIENLHDNIKKNGYDVVYDCGIHDCIFTIYSFDLHNKDKILYKKIESFIKKQSFIKSYNFKFIENEDN